MISTAKNIRKTLFQANVKECYKTPIFREKSRIYPFGADKRVLSKSFTFLQ
jgi:hypothetical protein